MGTGNDIHISILSILKTGCIYRFRPTDFSEADEMIDRCIRFYDRERIR